MTIAQDFGDSEGGSHELRRHVNRMPFDGEDGLFYQSWYPICLSSDLTAGSVIGRDFLDGRVVVYRGANGKVAVTSAYCPHVGADLSVGKVIGDNIQCAFHHWEYDQDGKCVKTGIGDPPPPSACLFKFPTEERYGVVWVYNGQMAEWSLPHFDIPEDELLVSTQVTEDYGCDGWIFACNTPDMQHIKVVHGVQFKIEDPHDLVDWDKNGFDYDLSAGHQGGVPIEWRVGIRGSSMYWQRGTVDGWWLGVYAGFSCPEPGVHQAFYALAVRKEDGDLPAEQRMQMASDLLERTAGEDKDILNSIHYAPGNLTKGDRTLAQFLQFLRTYPRAHPSRDFIR